MQKKKEAWERVIDVMNHYGLNKNSLSKKVGISNNVTIGRIVNERRNPIKRTLNIIADACPEISRDWLVSGKGEMILNSPVPRENTDMAVTGKVVPLYEAESAAGVDYATDMTPASFVSTIDVGSMLKDSEAAIRVYGNSMVPNYPAGCVIGTRLHTDSFIEPGRVYVIETRGGRYIKRLYYNDNKSAFQCVSDNHMLYEEGPRKGKPCYPEFEVPMDEIIRLHKVVGVIKRNIL